MDADTSLFGSEDATPGFRARVCACSSWPGWAGRPPVRIPVRPTFFLWPSCPSSLFGPLRAGVALASSVFFFAVPHFSFPFLPSPPWHPRCLWLFVLPGPGCPGPWRSLFLLRSCLPCPVFFSFWLCFPSYTLLAVLCVVAFGALGLAAPPLFRPPLFLLLFSRCVLPFCAPSSRLPCLGVSVVYSPGCPGPWRSVSCLSLLFLFFFLFSRCCFALPLFLVPGALGALGLWSAWLGSFFLHRVRPCVWCVGRGRGCRPRRSLLVLPCCCVPASPCRVLLPVIAGWSLLGLVCRLLFSARVLWHGWSCLAAWLAALLCEQNVGVPLC